MLLTIKKAECTLGRPKLRVLSLGAGVQSTTLLLMSCWGELPRLDAAVFADTGWEPKSVYHHLTWLKDESAKHGIPIHVVSNGNIKDDALRSQVRGRGDTRSVSMPYFVLGPNGERGMIRRQCTTDYKIVPIRREVRALAGYAPRQRIPSATVQQWIGISADERRRQRVSGEQWRYNMYPLLDLGMSRLSCYDWLRDHGFAEPPRSACIGCPFRSDSEWRWLRDFEPESWQDAIAFDRAIRNCGGMRGQIFLHAQRVPLDQVNLKTDADYGQGVLFDRLCSTCMTQKQQNLRKHTSCARNTRESQT